MKTISAIFADRLTAERAFTHLEILGIAHDNISLLMSDEARKYFYSIEESSKVDEGTAAGAGIGGIIGAIAGIVLSAGVLVIPGLNLVIAGALVSSLAGLGVGGLAGGLVGFLIGAGIPEHEAKMYEQEIKQGNVLVAVKTHTDEQAKQVEETFRSFDAKHLAA